MALISSDFGDKQGLKHRVVDVAETDSPADAPFLWRVAAEQGNKEAVAAIYKNAQFMPKPFQINLLEAGGNDPSKRRKICLKEGDACEPLKAQCCLDLLCQNSPTESWQACTVVPGVALSEKREPMMGEVNGRAPAFPNLSGLKKTTKKLALLQIYAGSLFPFFPLAVASYAANKDYADFILVHVGHSKAFYGLSPPGTGAHMRGMRMGG